jgi:hypothetical protein
MESKLYIFYRVTIFEHLMVILLCILWGNVVMITIE